MKVVLPDRGHRPLLSPGCGGKIRHGTRAQAEKAMLAVKAPGGRAGAYTCQLCGAWHWGRNRQLSRRAAGRHQ
jgi:hypothetical protein